MVTMGMFEGGIIQAAGEASLRIAATVVDKDGNGLGDLETIALRAVAGWEAEFVKAGMTLTPPPQRQSEYQKLSGWLQAIGMQFKAELPSGATSLLMKVIKGKVLVEVYDRMGKKIGDIPNEKTSIEFRNMLQHTFQSSVSPDHDGVIALV